MCPGISGYAVFFIGELSVDLSNPATTPTSVYYGKGLSIFLDLRIALRIQEHVNLHDGANRQQALAFLEYIHSAGLPQND